MDIYFELYNHSLFRILSHDGLMSLSGAFREYSCDEGAVLYYSKDGGGSFFLFVDGEFCAATADNRRKRFFLPGDYSDPETLLSREIRDDTLLCRSPGSYLRIERADYIDVLKTMKKQDQIILGEIFGSDLSGRENLRAAGSEELLCWRKSGFYLIEQLKYPLLVLSGLLAVSRFFHFPYDLYFYRPASALLVLYTVLKSSLWFSEKYSLNDSELSSVKFSFSPFGMRRIVLPVDQITGMKIEKKKLRNRFFNVGSLHILTSSGTVMMLGDLDRPVDLERKISGVMKKTREFDKVREKLDIRRKMEEHFEVKTDIREQSPPGEAGPTEQKVIFRKSVASLLASTWWQFFFAGGLSFLSWLFRDSGGIFIFVTVLPFVGIFFWRFQDWRNDLYMVSGGKITDINRKPFGKSEVSNLADMEYVTNIKSEKKGLFRYLFNFGDVIIETAGGCLSFEMVSDPRGVQSRLLDLREAWKKSEEKKLRNRQFQDFLVYSEIYKQAEEQNRLNRLTPPAPGGAQQGVQYR